MTDKPKQLTRPVDTAVAPQNPHLLYVHMYMHTEYVYVYSRTAGWHWSLVAPGGGCYCYGDHVTGAGRGCRSPPWGGGNQSGAARGRVFGLSLSRLLVSR